MPGPILGLPTLYPVVIAVIPVHDAPRIRFAYTDVELPPTELHVRLRSAGGKPWRVTSVVAWNGNRQQWWYANDEGRINGPAWLAEATALADSHVNAQLSTPGDR